MALLVTVWLVVGGGYRVHIERIEEGYRQCQAAQHQREFTEFNPLDTLGVVRFCERIVS